MTKLLPELITQTSFFKNLRSLLPTTTWNKLRHQTYTAANHTCQICGAKNTTLHCHETWSYNTQTHTQKLEGLIALCPNCHEVKHIGLAKMRGRYTHAITHMCLVNNMTLTEAQHAITHAWTTWHKHNQITWTLDTSLITPP